VSEGASVLDLKERGDVYQEADDAGEDHHKPKVGIK